MAATTRTQDDWIDELNVRFLLNQADEELMNTNRIFFQVEEAQWVWEDWVRREDRSLPKLSVLGLAEKMFRRSQLFCGMSRADFITAHQNWKDYKSMVPVRGAIMLNQAMTHVVLVQPYKGNRWSFPRGKINQCEEDLDCAVREAFEETGFDLRKAGLVLSPEEMAARRIEKTVRVPDNFDNPRDQHNCFFIFRGVPEDAHFETQTMREIGAIEWWPVADLPMPRNRRGQNAEVTGPNIFFNMHNFTPDLRAWIKRQARADRHNPQARGRPAPVLTGATDTEDIDAGDTTTDDAPPAEGDATDATDAAHAADANFAALVSKLGQSQSQRPSDSLPEVSQTNGAQQSRSEDQAAALKRALGVGFPTSSQPAPANGQVSAMLPMHDRPQPPLQFVSQSSQPQSSPHHEVHFFPTLHGSQSHGQSPFAHHGRMGSGPLQPPQMPPGQCTSIPPGFVPPPPQHNPQPFPVHGPAISRQLSADPAVALHRAPGAPEFGIHGPTIPRAPKMSGFNLTQQTLRLHNTLQEKFPPGAGPTAPQGGGQDQMMEQYRKEKERRDRQTQQMYPPQGQGSQMPSQIQHQHMQPPMPPHPGQPFGTTPSLPGQRPYVPAISQNAFQGPPSASAQSFSSAQGPNIFGVAPPQPAFNTSQAPSSMATNNASDQPHSLRSAQNGSAYTQGPPQFQSPQQVQPQVVQQPVPKNKQASTLLGLFKSGAAPAISSPALQKAEPAELSAQPPTPGYNNSSFPQAAENRAHAAPPPAMDSNAEKTPAKPGLTGATVSGPINAPEFAILKKNSHPPVEPATAPAQPKPFAPQQILKRENARQTASPTEMASHKKPASPARRPPKKAPSPPKQQLKPFQPQQILKRGQPNPLAAGDSPATAAVSPTTLVPVEKTVPRRASPFAEQVNAVSAAAEEVGRTSAPRAAPAPAPAATAAPAAASAPLQSPPSTHTAALAAPAAPAFDRRGSQTTDQRNALLSMFTTKPSSQPTTSPVQATRSPLPAHALPHRDPHSPRTAFSGLMSPVSPLAEGASAHNTPPHLRSRISSMGETPVGVLGMGMGGIGAGNGATFETPQKPVYGGNVDVVGVNMSLNGNGDGNRGIDRASATSPENTKFLRGFLANFASKGGN